MSDEPVNNGDEAKDNSTDADLTTDDLGLHDEPTNREPTQDVGDPESSTSLDEELVATVKQYGFDGNEFETPAEAKKVIDAVQRQLYQLGKNGAAGANGSARLSPLPTEEKDEDDPGAEKFLVKLPEDALDNEEKLASVIQGVADHFQKQLDKVLGEQKEFTQARKQHEETTQAQNDQALVKQLNGFMESNTGPWQDVLGTEGVLSGSLSPEVSERRRTVVKHMEGLIHGYRNAGILQNFTPDQLWKAARDMAFPQVAQKAKSRSARKDIKDRAKGTSSRPSHTRNPDADAEVAEAEKMAKVNALFREHGVT